jgi:adenylate cyclase
MTAEQTQERGEGRFRQAMRRRALGLPQDYRAALTREVLRTELTRVKAMGASALVIAAAMFIVFTLFPDHVRHLWRGSMLPNTMYAILVPFILFEAGVYALVRRQLRLGGELPAPRRYLGALIEMSFPSAALMLHIDNMGSVQALGFVVPFSYFIFIILSTLRLDFWLSVFSGAVGAAELFALAMWYHPEAPPDVDVHAARSLVLLGCGVLAGAVGVEVRRQFEATIAAVTARDRVTDMFGQHVSPQVVERLLAEGAGPASELRRVVVMFVDFRHFTADARSRRPQEVVRRLDGAFAVLVEVLDRHDGIVNKFLGDGFLALFGVPFDSGDAPRDAVAAAREMLAAIDRDNAGAAWPLEIGIGLHVGDVVAGTIGSARRKEYTVIGDTVNRASRIEALNKEFGSRLLVSAEIMAAIGPDADARDLGEVAIRGYDAPIRVWRLA